MRDVNWDLIYNIDLVYEKDCWEKCGDAHCCNFSRHKNRFMFIGKKYFQELPLLPGEYDYLLKTKRLQQFGEHKHKQAGFSLPRNRTLILDSIVSYRTGCACEHAHRPTVCRLYPLFPKLDIDGRLLGVDTNFGIYEELESIEYIGRACEIQTISFDQLNLFLRLVEELARSPLHIFYLQAYSLAKRRISDRLRSARAATGQNSFSLFEVDLLKGMLFDDSLIVGLGELCDQFADRYGVHFRLLSETDRTSGEETR
jgi:hypothetical protein